MAGEPRVLLLGGSTEAAALAEALASRVRLTTTLAGVTRSPRTLPGEIVVGGFGGAAGLRRWLKAEQIDVLIDATHPYAARIARNARRAALAAGVQRLKLWRPPWSPESGDAWHDVPHMAAAAQVAARLGRRPLVSLGARGLAGFALEAFEQAFVRAIERPPALPANAYWIEARGPFAVADEQALLQRHRIDVIVAKNAGGEATRAKLAAARLARLPVVMIERPPRPAGPWVETVPEAVAWLDQALASRQT